MNLQADRVFSPVNSIVGRSAAGDTRRSAYAANAGARAAPTASGHPSARAPQTLSLVSSATGVLIYESSAGKTDPAKFEWAFKAPEADLFDLSGRKTGKHYAGPTWESNDGSKVVGEVKARDDGPDANAIPWLLLSAKTTSGAGVFGQTKSIQRLHTAGGKAPAETCDRAQLGKQARGAHRATDYFYIAKP